MEAIFFDQTAAMAHTAYTCKPIADALLDTPFPGGDN